jgi:lipase ATG15
VAVQSFMVSSSCCPAHFHRALAFTHSLILLDTVEKLGWSVDIRTHRISVVIEHLLKEGWDGSKSPTPTESLRPDLAKPTANSRLSWHFPGWRRRPGNDDGDGDEGGDGKGSVPPAVPIVDCVDCFRWEFGDGEGFE